jgi:ribosomal protein S27AE
MNDRRGFLKGSALLAGLLLVPNALAAQDAQRNDKPSADPPKDPAKDPAPPDGGDNAKDKDEKTTEKTYVGADGRPYRICPQCGANMYRQDRTWTCENCGYSYDE